MDEENSIVSGAASTDVGATYSDDEFRAGLLEEFGLENPAAESGFAPEETSGEDEEGEAPSVEDGAGESGKSEETEETGAAESGEEGVTEPETVEFVESGKRFSAPKEAVEAFANAVGRTAENLIDVYQKGCNYDKLKARLDEAMKTEEIFERAAAISGISAKEAKEDFIGRLERIPLEQMANQIRAENPGMKPETAMELAKFRIGEQKPKAEEPVGNGNSEEAEGRIREIEIFEARHPELGKLPNEIIEAWQKTGISLEAAYDGYLAKKEAAELRAENERLKKEATMKGQKNYAREHSPGSAATASGKEPVDDFAAGLFIDY